MFDTLFYNPIYNLVIFLSNHIEDIGIVIILSTVIIKIILFPFFNRQIGNQIAMRNAKPALDKLSKKYKGKKLTQEENQVKVKETMALYKEYNLKPFSSLFILILQIPILFALYWVFFNGGLPEIDKESLYSFIDIPKNIDLNFLGIFPVLETSYFLAFLAAITQFMHLSISMPDVKFSDFKNKTGVMKEDMMNSFQVNIKYGLPVLIFFIIPFFNSAVAIYWITSNIFMFGQEYLVREKKQALRKKKK